MPPVLNWLLAYIATAMGIAEILSWLPSTWLIAVSVIGIAAGTWALLHRFGIRQRRIDARAERQRRTLGY